MWMLIWTVALYGFAGIGLLTTMALAVVGLLSWGYAKGER